MTRCTITSAVRYPVNKGIDPITVTAGDTQSTACERTKKKTVSCITSYSDRTIKPTAVYEGTIVRETGVGITIETERGGDYIDINPVENSAVMLTRIWTFGGGLGRIHLAAGS